MMWWTQRIEGRFPGEVARSRVPDVEGRVIPSATGWTFRGPEPSRGAQRSWVEEWLK